MDSSLFLHKLNYTPDAAWRDAQSPLPPGASEVLGRHTKWDLSGNRLVKNSQQTSLKGDWMIIRPDELKWANQIDFTSAMGLL